MAADSKFMIEAITHGLVKGSSTEVAGALESGFESVLRMVHAIEGKERVKVIEAAATAGLLEEREARLLLQRALALLDLGVASLIDEQGVRDELIERRIREWYR